MGRLIARVSLTLLMACHFVRPLPMSECFYCRSFLWHLSPSLFHHKSGSLGFLGSYQTMNGHNLYLFIIFEDTILHIGSKDKDDEMPLHHGMHPCGNKHQSMVDCQLCFERP
jgi:hypothetical protein